MNAPVDLHFSPIASVVQAYETTEANRILWDVVRDCFSGKQAVRAELKTFKLSARATFRAPWATLTMTQSPQLQGLYQSELFPPATAMLAGACRHIFSFQPDFASISLYADGDDYLGWHTDYDAYVGPAGGHSPVATFSFGAERLLRFMRIGSTEPVDSLRPAHGSAYLMDPRCQRYFCHSVPVSETPVGARIAVTFFCGQRDDPRRIWWTLVDNETELPLVCAAPLDAYKASVGRENCTLLTPWGQIDNKYVAEERLGQLGLLDDDARAEISALRERAVQPDRKPRRTIAELEQTGELDAPPPPLPQSMLDDATIDILMSDPTAVLMARGVMERTRCNRCEHACVPFALTQQAIDLIGALPCSVYLGMCLGCVQTILGRPLRPSELAVAPINRTILQAFTLGCDHNLLEERRTEAQNLINEIERVFGPTRSS